MNLAPVAMTLSALLLAGGAARADEFPARKPGLWQVDMAMPGHQMPPQQMKLCIDAATDADMYKLGMNASRGMCDPPEIRRNGNTVSVHSACKMGDSQATTQALTTFMGDTAYHTDASTKFEPPMAGRSEQSMTQDAKWAGPCPADMAAGDMVMGNGMKMNIRQMLGGKP
jgi:hypothetical protein